VKGKLITFLRNVPIDKINELYGELGVITKASVARIEDLDALLSEKMRKIEGIALTATIIVAK